MNVFTAVGFVLLIVADQVAKYFANLHLAKGASVIVVPGFLGLTFLKNDGAAFGFLQGGGGRIFFLIVVPVILVAVVIYFFKLPRKGGVYAWIRTALVLIGAGAIGNYIDRVRLGYVIDFFEFKFINFPVFNVADMYVVVGTILLAVMLIFFLKEEKA